MKPCCVSSVGVSQSERVCACVLPATVSIRDLGVSENDHEQLKVEVSSGV